MKSTFTLLIFLLLISGCDKKTDKDITSTQISTTQCMKDTDCKGDRICEVGVYYFTTIKFNSYGKQKLSCHWDKKRGSTETNSPLDSGTNSQCEGINGAPAFGSSFNGGAYLCREKVETYWNDWYALNASHSNRFRISAIKWRTPTPEMMVASPFFVSMSMRIFTFPL